MLVSWEKIGPASKTLEKKKKVEGDNTELMNMLQWTGGGKHQLHGCRTRTERTEKTPHTFLSYKDSTNVYVTAKKAHTNLKAGYWDKTTDWQGHNILRSTKKRRSCESITTNLAFQFWNDSVHADVRTFFRERVRETYCVFSVFSLLNIYHCSEDKCFSFSITRLINGIMDKMLDVVFKHVSCCNSTVFG